MLTLNLTMVNLMFSLELISKYEYSFLLNGKVYLIDKTFSSNIQDYMYKYKNEGLEGVFGPVIEDTDQFFSVQGYDRKFFNDCFDIVDNDHIPIGYSCEEYSELCQIIELFDAEENRWKIITSSPTYVLYAVKEYQSLPDITNAQVSLIKQAVKEKMSYADMFYDDLNQSSLVKVIYGVIHKQMMITSIHQIKQKHFDLLLRFIEDLNIFLHLGNVKRL